VIFPSLAQTLDWAAFIPRICQKLKISERTQKSSIFDEFVGILPKLFIIITTNDTQYFIFNIFIYFFIGVIFI